MVSDSGPFTGPSYELLHERARELIKNGTLPQVNPSSTYGGYGTDRKCQLCAASITSKEVEYELEFTSSGERPLQKQLVWFHLACHAIWDYERKHLK